MSLSPSAAALPSRTCLPLPQQCHLPLLLPGNPSPLQVCWRVACFFPGVTVSVMTFVNVFLWATGSSGAIPLGFFFSIIFLW